MAPKAKRRSKFWETKYFGFVIGLIIISLFFSVAQTTTLFKGLELKIFDLHLVLKSWFKTRHLQEGVTFTEQNLKRSEDINIIGIDATTLAEYGKFPFPRYHFADLINAYSRIKNQALRESALYLDVFFVDKDSNAADDALLESAIRSSSKVVLETVLRKDFPSSSLDESEFWERHALLESRMPSVANVKGNWQRVPEFLGFEAPLKPFAGGVMTYGHANFIEDLDDVYRRQPLVAKISQLIELIPLDGLSTSLSIKPENFERICWMDFSGNFHEIAYPLTEKTVAELKRILPKRSPPKVEDTDEDGQPDKEVFVIRKYRDYFTPAVTLSLALNYFNKKPQDIEVVLGKHIRIPSPQIWDAENARWVPYSIQVEKDQTDRETGELIKLGKRLEIPEILIPINENAQMLINYMGYRSSEAGEGNQTFPVRSFSELAGRVKPADPELWRESMAASNKILMVGAFARGMAQDEKPTPLGLMYGIEIHANALNTILMNNFVKVMPVWVNLLILSALVLIVCFMSSRMPSLISLGISLILIVGFFFGVSMLFDNAGILVDFSTPSLGDDFFLRGHYRLSRHDRREG